MARRPYQYERYGAYIMDNYKKMGPKAIALELGIPRNSVISIHHRLLGRRKPSIEFKYSDDEREVPKPTVPKVKMDR